MARKTTGAARPKRSVTVLLEPDEADLLDMAVIALNSPPGVVLTRGLYLVGLAGQLVLGHGRVLLNGSDVQASGVQRLIQANA